jgi:hypothetical protein
VALLMSPVSLLAAATSISGTPGLTVSVNPTGAYDIYTQAPAWHFGGNVGSSLSNISTVTGLDGVGNYNEVSFDFQAGVPRHAAIRAYWNQPAVLFTLSWTVAAINNFAFPNISVYPAGLNHIGYSGVFANPTFTGLTEEGPWAFFDSAANTFLISPAANFMVTSASQWGDGTISMGIDSQIPSLPQGFTHQTLLVAQHGINNAFETWGKILAGLSGKTKPANDADTSLNLLGYWTDNGATYYYHTEGSLSYMDTLAGVKADFDSHGIGLGYMQLDSWFYPKGPASDWTDGADGIAQYQAAPILFGSNLAGFQQRVGVPLITHARWIDPSSPYRQQYQMSNNVSIDPAYWRSVASYLNGSGVITYEQDWLVGPALPNFNLTDADAFLGNMASAMSQQSMTIQYCMPSPRHVMQSSKYKNLTTIRGSNDRFNPNRWTPFLYESRLVSSSGAWPFTDVFMSTERSNLLLATLSAGPVGVGDQIGTMSTPNLLQAVRIDGVIVKPDFSLMPLDGTYLNDSQALGTPMIAATHTAYGNTKIHYVVEYAQAAVNQASFTLADLGMTGTAYVYDYFSGSGKVVAPADTYTRTVTSDLLYLVVSPIGSSGMALIGDTGQFVTAGKKRITAFEDNGSLNLTVAFANGEAPRRIEGYSPVAPHVSASAGSIAQFAYDSAAQRFSFQVTPGADGASATVVISKRPPVAK